MILQFITIYFCKLAHPPPLYTTLNPFWSNKLLAEALRMPLAQQVIMGLDLSSIFSLLPNSCKGIFIEPLICPDWYSPGERTSTIWAPFFTKLVKSTAGAVPNNFFKKLSIFLIGFDEIKWIDSTYGNRSNSFYSECLFSHNSLQFILDWFFRVETN